MKANLGSIRGESERELYITATTFSGANAIDKMRRLYGLTGHSAVTFHADIYYPVHYISQR